MKKIALIELKLEKTDKYIFQRRDGNAYTSPHLLAFFGGRVNPGEPAYEAAIRELQEETSLDAGRLALAHVLSLEMPPELNGKVEPLELHLFSAIVPNANFAVYEGVGGEVYSRQDALSRNDLAPTMRYLLEKGDIYHR